MRIAIDMSAVRLSGPRAYCSGFLTALARLLDGSDELIVFGPDDIADIVEPLTGPRFRFLADPRLKRVPARIWWQQWELPGLLSRLRTEILFEPFDMGPWRGGCPMVVGVRNPNPIVLAGGVLPLTWSRRTFGRVHQFLVSGTCARARLLIFPSRFAAEALGRRLPGGPERRRVVHHGLDTEFWTDAKTAEEAPRRRYILFASKFYPQKRAELLLEAFAEWRRRYGRSDIRLIYCGEERESARARALLARAAGLGLSDSVELLGIVSRPELRALYRGASELVLPTVMETFGFPYIEAMASRTPLVCADIEIARELCGDAPWYFRPDDRDSLAEALEAGLGNGPETARKLALGEGRAKDFSWEREARETLACLREAAAL